MSAETESSARRRPTCARCGTVIGVYEPLVHVAGETVRRTSRAAEPDVAAAAGSVYHDECYEPGVVGA